MMDQGLGVSQRAILEHLKRRGSSAIKAMARDLGLNVETVRAHLRTLGSAGLVDRVGTRSDGPGRPEIVYGLTDAAEEWFPNRAGDILQQLATYLGTVGEGEVMDDFFSDQVDRRRSAAMSRVEGLSGEARLQEVARILSEDGFMAEVHTEATGERTLRLAHCPLGKLIDTTRAPCRAELSLVRELSGKQLARVGYIPTGDLACCYTVVEGG